MQPLISIIVPIYKVELYLRQCVDSILAQTYTNLEIILVDDGSPDNCGAICDEYAEKDPRIKVIHKENGGHSSARNMGLEHMTGEYLMFVDSDDWLTDDAVMVLFDLIVEHDATLVIGGQRQIDDLTNEVIFTNCTGPVKAFIQSKADAFDSMLKYGCTVWARLYRSELFQDIRFPPITRHEDEAVMLEVLSKCGKIIKVNAPIYYYRRREGSILTSSFTADNLAWYTEGKKQYDWVCQNIPELKPVARKRVYDSIYVLLLEIASEHRKYQKLAKPLLKDLRETYPDMKLYVHEEGKSALRLAMLRYLPYPIFCAISKFTHRLHHK